jgi:carboxyl-terminal processing protease
MRSPRSLLAPLAVLLVAVFSGGWFLQRGVGQERNLYFQARLFEEVVDFVANRYVEPVERDSLYQSAIDGILESLGDPATTFLDVSQWENLRLRTEGEYGGVGLEIVERGEWVTVVTAMPGTPGTRAGIRPGDQFFEVAGEPARGWTSDQAVERLRGAPGTTVDVRMLRPGVEEPIPFTLTRAVITVRTVPFATMLEGSIGYVPLQMVSETSTEEVRAAVDSLRAEGAAGLVLDLRGNPGGVLDQGIAISDLFLEPGRTVVETRGRTPDQNAVYQTRSPDQYPGLPVVLLIDEQSVSAAEIIAGALQDHDRALLIGANTFGKGSVQSLYRLTGGSVLKLTTAKWYTPSGRSIQKPLDEQFSMGDQGVLSLSGTPVSRPDTADRPRYRSSAGRELLGGGGITPDLQVMMDTLSTSEQGALRGLYAAAGTFNSVLFNWVAEYANGRTSLPDGFSLSASELEDFHAALAQAGLEIDRSVLQGAERYIRYHLEREIARSIGGELAEFQRVRRDDAQLERAVELLSRSDSPQELLRISGNPLPGGGASGVGEEGTPQQPSAPGAGDSDPGSTP